MKLSAVSVGDLLSMSHGQSPLQRLQQAFSTADEDGDDLLNKKEFEKFVFIGYRKVSLL